MKKIEVSDDVYAALQRLATESQRSPDEILASLLHVAPNAPDAADPIAAFVTGSAFHAQPSSADKYLALLGWIATHHATEFGEFVRNVGGGRRYLGLDRDAIVAICRHNQARQIDGTQYWAVMNLDAQTRRDFVARVLEFIGYHDDVIDFVCALLGGPHRRRRRRRFVSLVA